MNIVLPAEAGLDLYKAAYVIYKINNLRLSNISFLYPHKPCNIGHKDIVLGMHLEKTRQQQFMSFEEVLSHYGDCATYAFLRQIPDDVVYGFHAADKMYSCMKIFDFFEAYRTAIILHTNVASITDQHYVHEINEYKVLVQNGNIFITPDERIVLFRQGFDYVVFCAAPQVGVQKNLCKHIPSCTALAAHARYSSDEWFMHKKGHLIMSREKMSLDALLHNLTNFLNSCPSKAG